MNTPVRGAAVLLVLAAMGAFAAPRDAEQDRIAAERAAAVAKFAQQQKACRARFVVASCLDEVHKEQQATLTRLHRREMQLDDIRRHEAGAARHQAVRDKVGAMESRGADDAASAARRDAGRELPGPRAGERPDRNVSLSKTPAGRPSAMPRAAEERNEAKFEARRRAAQAHREAVEQRSAQRAARGNAAAPLPPLAGATAP